MVIKINKPSDLAPYIDHTVLKKDASEEDIKKLCAEAKQYNFGAVCIRSEWVKMAKELLKNTPVKVCSVVGFPLDSTSPENCHFGNIPTEEKVKEAQKAIADGADELDMVINLDALRSGDLERVKNDIAAVKKVAGDKVLKVIIEARLLNEEQKKNACRISEEAGADFVKTSTGFVKEKGETLGALEEDVELMRKMVGDRLGVKASGGIRDFQKAKAMIDAGANRLGCSASVSIVKGK